MKFPVKTKAENYVKMAVEVYSKTSPRMYETKYFLK